MCGLTGFWGFSHITDRSQLIRRMNNSLHHRGPDSSGIWHENDHTIYLGHQRLSIVDLTASGSQPMHSQSGNLVLVFNGEIYNHQELRGDVDPHSSYPWKGRSDTEVFLRLIEVYGVPTALSKCVGMFAFALYNRSTRNLVIGRDRAGEKPLYFYQGSGGLAVSSEAGSFRSIPGLPLTLSPDSLFDYFSRSYISAPHSIFKEVSKVRPGTYLVFDSYSLPPTEHIYWDLNSSIDTSSSFTSLQQATTVLLDQLRQSVSQQMQADVDVGVFLSGGIDSSLIVSLMREQSASTIHSFSVGFDNNDFDESPYASQISRYLGTTHHQFIFDENDLLNTIYNLPAIYGEPFADSSQIPSLFLAQGARQHVKVSLTGDGGDELFCGYSHYQRISKLYRCSKLISSLKPLAGAFEYCFRPTLKSFLSNRRLASVDRISRSFSQSGPINFYSAFTSLWSNQPPLHQDYLDSLTSPPRQKSHWQYQHNDILNQFCLYDFQYYLSDDILTKVDRASMASSLETRIPLLDHRVIELAFNLPMEYKSFQGVSKFILREILSAYIPRQLFDRPKKGFTVPLTDWLRVPLREWTYSVLSPQKMKQDGVLDHKRISTYLNAFHDGADHLKSEIWNALVFQIWFDSQRG